jgi:hypothetical protein
VVVHTADEVGAGSNADPKSIILHGSNGVSKEEKLEGASNSFERGQVLSRQANSTALSASTSITGNPPGASEVP